MQQYQIELWSPKFSGSKVAWDWICKASNGSPTEPQFLMSREQLQDARGCGYLTTEPRLFQKQNTIVGDRRTLRVLAEGLLLEAN